MYLPISALVREKYGFFRRNEGGDSAWISRKRNCRKNSSFSFFMGFSSVKEKWFG